MSDTSLAAGFGGLVRMMQGSGIDTAEKNPKLALHHCSFCASVEPHHKKFAKCGACDKNSKHMAYYCSRECKRFIFCAVFPIT